MSFPVRAERISEWSGQKSSLLTRDDLDTVRDVLAEVAPSWTADLNHGGPHDSTVVVTPEGANDLIGPAFVLHRSDGSVRLAQFRWDEYRELGSFRTLDHALAVLRSRLLVLSPRATDPGGSE